MMLGVINLKWVSLNKNQGIGKPVFLLQPLEENPFLCLFSF